MSKRRWFQFHLSTAIVLMFVAGGLLWLNLRRRPWHYPPEDWGWPLRAHAIYRRGYSSAETIWYTSDEWYIGNLVLDVGIEIVILMLIAFLCEWRIRRKATKL